VLVVVEELPQPLATTASTTHALMTRELAIARCYPMSGL
jgi:hypothetical protein